ncbi:MAG TPA: hypothetical protein VF260_08880 [Bacilli bacterium]
MEQLLAKAQDNGCDFDIGGNRIGLYETPDGPKLLFNRLTFPLAESMWDAELVMGEKNNLFIFYWEGQVRVALRFSAMPEQFVGMVRRLQNIREGCRKTC